MKIILFFLDSLSSPQAIIHVCPNNHLVINILKLHSTFIDRDKPIIFAWVPSHVGIPGNTIICQAAKEALHGPVTVHNIPNILQNDLHAFATYDRGNGSV